MSNLHMAALDDTDQRLLAALKRDSRASISELAGALRLSRATVTSRIAKLVANGVIRRFTIELGEGAEQERVRAVVMIALATGYSRAVIKALHAIPAVARLHSTNGGWDLVADLDCASLSAFDHALRAIRDVSGVTNSQSSLLLDRLSP